ncbi:MAG: YgjV family protein [Clostridia bacterium]|nr:YgjV family protein [Clostridia bacterium]
MEIAAQIIGFFGTGMSFLSFLMPKKKLIIIFQVIAVASFTLHYFLLGGYTGAIMNVIALSKIALYYFENKPWFKNVLFTCIYLAVIVVTAVFTWQDISSLFPLLAMIIHTLVYNIKSEKWLRIGLFPASLLWMVYAIMKGSIPALIGEILNTSSIIAAFIHYDILKKGPKKPVEEH